MIIGLIGYMGSGKTEVAKSLVELHGFKRERMAGPLKDMLRAIGLTDAQVDGDQKEAPCALLGGATPRHAMQTLGTEWGRDLIHPDLWMTLWRARVANLPLVVCDDVRFHNEVDAIRDLGGVIWRVNRASVLKSAHISEQLMDRVVADVEIDNSGTLEELRRGVDRRRAAELWPHLVAA